MKKATAFILVLTLTLLCCACGDSSTSDTNSVSEKQYTIYSDVTDGTSNAKKAYRDSVNENITFDAFAKKDFSFMNKTQMKNPDAPSKKSFTIDGKSFELDLTRSYSTSIATSNIGKTKKIGFYDFYRLKDENGSEKINIEFLQNTDVPVFYINYKNGTTETGDFTSKEAKEKADKLITELYGLEIASKFTYESTSEVDSQMTKGFSVIYRRYVHSYFTDEYIMITFNTEGEIIAINAGKLSAYDLIEKEISKKDIEKAHKVLLDSLHESWTSISEPELMIDSEGICYVCVYTSRPSSGEESSHDMASFYINVN